MLPAHIIAKILEKERREGVDNRPQISLEIPEVLPEFVQVTTNDSPQRGVVVVDLLGE